jgi:hypothetical protein
MAEFEFVVSAEKNINTRLASNPELLAELLVETCTLKSNLYHSNVLIVTGIPSLSSASE